jgi:hypothetical protein
LAAIFAGLFLTGIQAASAGTADDAASFVRKINAERSSRGLRSLVMRSDLAAIARAHSRAMAGDGYIYHSSNLPSKVSGDWRLIGENVGEGPDVQSLHDAFMASPAHRKNVLESVFNQVGIGVVRAGDGTLYVTEVYAARGSSSPVSTVSKARPKLKAKATKSTSARRTQTTASKPAAKPAARASANDSAHETIVALQRMALETV